MQQQTAPIGIFDSGYGGLTVMQEIVKVLPQYDYIYLGDNARTPYGNRSYQTIYEYTLQAVNWFFAQGCQLVILACNTASAKALRTIQQKDLPVIAPNRRVLGVIRPTTEAVGQFSKTNKVGIVATKGTVNSNSYPIEINKFFPQIQVYQQACPMWVPLVENNEHEKSGADYFIQQDIQTLFANGKDIDVLVLGCTHYPLLKQKIRQYLPPQVQLLAQGEIVAQSLVQYLQRHPNLENLCSKNGTRAFNTTDDTADFDNHAAIFYGSTVQSQHIDL